SLWSATGLPIALALGINSFKQLLDGAAAIDQHFQETDFKNNIPVIMGMLDVWYNNFMDADTHAFVPYDEALNLLPEYLSQLLMESNGKSANMNDEMIDYQTMPISWGSTGTNAQHAYFQLLHQGTRLVPVDFFAPLNKEGNAEHHALLLANCLAQSQALMQGEQSNHPHHFFPGNKPSNTLLYQQLSPEILGKILAIFEHRTFVQGVLWDINSFDQWGVELGKKLAKKVYQSMHDEPVNELDSSTKNMIELYKKYNN
ncbi:MAG: glucose-6-phosphate isomerase, partial [Pseudomonadota bacterium]